MRKERTTRVVSHLSPRTLAAVSTVLAAAGLFSPVAQAQTWDAGGAANTNWSTAANWNPDGLPTSGANVTFGTGGSIATLDADRTVGTLTFNRDANFTIEQ